MRHSAAGFRSTRLIRALQLTAIAWAGLAGPGFAEAPEFHEVACGEDTAKLGARCGVVAVPENYAEPKGRWIPLNVIVLPATQAKGNKQQAHFDLEGGPGFAATDFVAFYAEEGAAYRGPRDVVLADMRGTGESNPLRCMAIEEQPPGAPLYPTELVADCARQLAGNSDVRQYTTANAARDMESIRAALGYEQFVLNAVSYGTTLALRYIAEYPQRVRSAVLMGTAPARRTPPRYHAVAAQIEFNRLAADCAADADCQSRFGDVNANLRAARQRVLSIATLTEPMFLERIRTLLYAPASRSQLPALLARAASGDFRDFTSPAGDRVFADGLYLSITCAESFPNMDVSKAIDASRKTLFGAMRLERQRDACRQWPTAPRDPRLLLEPNSSVPVLFIAGALDPVTPVAWAQDVARHFANGRVVVTPQAAHVVDGLSNLDTCLDAKVLEFFETSNARALDLACFDDMQPPAFGAKPVPEDAASGEQPVQ